MENKQIDLIVLKKIQDVIKGLDDLDGMFAENSQNQSKNDSEISDWLHVLQDDESLDDVAIASIGKKIAELRKERNSLRNAYEIMKTFNENKNKLIHPDNRKFLIALVHKTRKNLNQPYKNRVISENEIDELKNKKKNDTTISTRGRKEELDIEKIKELLLSGMSQRKIAEKLNCAQPTISGYKKKLQERGEL